MADRPILFSAPMVCALLDGRKTQTRRILKPQPILGYAPDVTASKGVRFAKGDRLWCRETFSGPADQASMSPREWLSSEPIWYWADGNPTEGDWTKPKPGIHMPRWASRLTLTVSDVRVERLQAISEADAIAEGIIRYDADEFDNAEFAAFEGGDIYGTAVESYQALWDRINGALAWAANPWIVAATFRPERRNIDAQPTPPNQRQADGPPEPTPDRQRGAK